MIFLICPVRGIDNKTREDILQYVDNLEKQGITVYWPFRDTNQEGDNIGNRICTDNRQAIKDADEIHIWWSDSSQGTLFDLGMAWALKKPLRLANVFEPTATKSFKNLARWWATRKL